MLGVRSGNRLQLVCKRCCGGKHCLAAARQQLTGVPCIMDTSVTTACAMMRDALPRRPAMDRKMQSASVWGGAGPE